MGDLPPAAGDPFGDLEAVRASKRQLHYREGVGASASEELPEGSEEKLALEFAKRHANALRYVHAWGKWLYWTGTHWRTDTTLCAHDLVRTLCREAAAQATTERVRLALTSARTGMAALSLARADRRIAATAEQWDSDPWLLNTPEAVIDLRTSERRSACPGDHMTRIAGATPDETCKTPLWEHFLKRITGEDASLERFLQRLAGYALTGITREHAMFFCYGTGANGKSVFLRMLAACAGAESSESYHQMAPMEAFTVSMHERHPTEIAGLHGARLVTATETEDGRRWNESRIKVLTGGDIVSARFMKQDFFQFRPQFKLIIAGNHKPALRNIDEAMRRRLHLIPFRVTIPEEERDDGLGDKLLKELPGIMAWALEGCMDWQQRGLAPPPAVSSATAAYLDEEDAIAAWIASVRAQTGRALAEDLESWEQSSALFASWKAWAEKAGEHAGSMKRLSQNLEKRGYGISRRKAGRGFIGLKLPDQQDLVCEKWCV